jgi:tRNA pseudouridine32 synthase/23S rRNA pseudouridine746 synthase/23S rRNA pseudouridine1911/1915/1917 synthase
VHLSELGHPVVGDRKYGKGNDPYSTLALHARSISFTHPVNGRRLFFETGIPEFFTRLVGKIDLESNGQAVSPEASEFTS